MGLQRVGHDWVTLTYSCQSQVSTYNKEFTVHTEPLIQDNPECLKMVISGVKYHFLSQENWEELAEGKRPRRKKHDYWIAPFGGSQPQSCRYFFNPKLKREACSAQAWKWAYNFKILFWCLCSYKWPILNALLYTQPQVFRLLVKNLSNWGNKYQ